MSRRKYTEQCKYVFCSNSKDVKRISRNGDETTKDISYKLQLINKARYVESSLSNFVGGLAEGTHKIKCKYGHDDKKNVLKNACGIKHKYCEFCLKYTKVRDDLIEYKC